MTQILAILCFSLMVYEFKELLKKTAKTVNNRFLRSVWRREWDSNPRAVKQTVFKSLKAFGIPYSAML